MEIEQQNHTQNRQELAPFESMYEQDCDLVQQIVKVINSLFSPLNWILEETLYKRIKKEDKGWIDINYLNRNPSIKQIFKNNEIQFQSRRKRNILVNAIKKSILKKKKNLIKRKEYLNINLESKKVIYLQMTPTQQKTVENSLQQKQKIYNSQLHKISQSLFSKENLTRVIQRILEKRKDLSSVNEKIEEQQFSSSKNNKKINLQQRELQILGSETEKQNKLQRSYRWCFVYIPQLEINKVQQFQTLFKSILNFQQQQTKFNPNKSLFQVLENYFGSQIVLDDSFQTSFKIYTLKQMINIFYPAYEEICKNLGHERKNVRQQRLRIRRKRKQKQRIRLLESVDLQKKIDVVNQYHIKLQIQKQRKAYLKKKEAEYERKMRLREQRKLNKAKNKIDEEEQKKDHFTEKLRLLLGLNPLQEKKDTNQTIQISNVQAEQTLKQIQLENKKSQQEKQMNIHIKLPKYQEKYVQENSIQQEVKQKPQIYESFFEDRQDFHSSQNSQEDYELPKKKSSKKKLIEKKKKIVKNNIRDSKSSKSVRVQVSNKITNSIQKKQINDLSTNNSNSHSNSAYNLRHKAPVQGSYLKMVEYEVGRQQALNQKGKNDKYAKKFQNVIDQVHGLSHSQSLRVTRKQKVMITK